MTRTHTEIILASLMTDYGYAERWLPYFEPSYFGHYTVLYDSLSKYLTKYHRCPTKEEVLVETEWEMKANETHREAVETLVADMDRIVGEAPNADWLKDQTEAFIVQKYQEHHITEYLEKLQRGKGDAQQHIQALQQQPVFDDLKTLGLDNQAAGMADTLYAYLTQTDTRIPFDLQFLNSTVRGVKRKTLNVVLAPTNHGKSMFLCHLAAMYMRQGLNVLYLSMEMDEGTCLTRIHANLFDTPIEAMERWSLPEFQRQFSTVSKFGRLFVRSFPTGGAHAGHFRGYLSELEKSSFKPDVIMVDYLNICSSERLKANSQTPLYQLVGTISKELRALAQEQDAVVWSATQTNRAGLEGDVQLSNTSDSMQTAFDADLIISMWRDDSPLSAMRNKMHLRIAKDRNGGSGAAGKHGLIAYDSSRMKLFEIEDGDVAAVRSGIAKLAADKKTAKHYVSLASAMGATPPNSERKTTIRFAIDEDED